MPNEVLASDWSDYDMRKTKDKGLFTCERWEMDYLAEKIKKLYPSYNAKLVDRAVIIACKELKTPRSREAFVNRVMGNLRFLMR